MRVDRTRLATDKVRSVGLIMKHKPFEVEIKSRGPTFSKIIDEARRQARSVTEYHTLDMNDIILKDF